MTMNKQNTTPDWSIVEQWLETWNNNGHQGEVFDIPSTYVITEDEYEFDAHRYSLDVNGVYYDERSYEISFIGQCEYECIEFKADQIKEGEQELYEIVMKTINNYDNE